MNWKCCNWELDSDSEVLPMFIQISGTLLCGRILPNKRWILLRLLLAIITTLVCCNSIMFSMIHDHININWYFIYYTNWILWLVLLYFWSSFICTWVIYQSNVGAFRPYWISLRELHISPLVSINRISLYICLSSSWVAILAYWILIFQMDKITKGIWSIATQIMDNGIIYLLLWIDYLCSLHDIPARSVLYPLGCAFLYLILTVMFEHIPMHNTTHSTGYIYEFLQWSVENHRYGMAILISLVMFITIVLFQIMWVFTKQIQLQRVLSPEVVRDLDSKPFRELRETGKPAKIAPMKLHTTRKSSISIGAPSINKLKDMVQFKIKSKKNHKNTKNHRYSRHPHTPIKEEHDLDMINGTDMAITIHNSDVRVTHNIIEDEESSVRSD